MSEKRQGGCLGDMQAGNSVQIARAMSKNGNKIEMIEMIASEMRVVSVW